MANDDENKATACATRTNVVIERDRHGITRREVKTPVKK